MENDIGYNCFIFLLYTGSIGFILAIGAAISDYMEREK